MIIKNHLPAVISIVIGLIIIVLAVIALIRQPVDGPGFNREGWWCLNICGGHIQDTTEDGIIIPSAPPPPKEPLK